VTKDYENQQRRHSTQTTVR